MVFGSVVMMVKVSTIWSILGPVTQTHSARHTAVNLLCAYARVKPEQVAEGQLSDEDFEMLIGASGAIASAPLRVCDISTTEEFIEVTAQIAGQKTFTFILCDWPLSADEAEYAALMTEGSAIAIISPN